MAVSPWPFCPLLTTYHNSGAPFPKPTSVRSTRILLHFLSILKAQKYPQNSKAAGYVYHCAPTMQNISLQMQLSFYLSLSLWNPSKKGTCSEVNSHENGTQWRKWGWIINIFTLNNIWTHLQQWSFSICPTLHAEKLDFLPSGQSRTL